VRPYSMPRSTEKQLLLLSLISISEKCSPGCVLLVRVRPLKEFIMKPKSTHALMLILFFVLFFSSSAPAYADAVVISTLNLSNLQITSMAGSIQFGGAWQATAATQATNSFGELSSQFDSSLGGTAVANAMVNFASAQGIANAVNLTAGGTSQVNITGGTFQASSSGQAFLVNTFMITGGTGDVDVTFSAMINGMQSLMTDAFGEFAESDAIFTLELDGDPVLFSASQLTGGPNTSMQQQIAQALSNTVTLQYNTTYQINVGVDPDIPPVTNSIPEPSTIILMISGVGFMLGFARKRRTATTSPTTTDKRVFRKGEMS